MRCFPFFPFFSNYLKDPAGTGRTLSVPPVTRGSRGKKNFLCVSNRLSLSLSGFCYFRVSSSPLKRLGGVFLIDRPPIAKKHQPDRQTESRARRLSVNRAVCAGTRVYSGPVKSQYEESRLSAVRLPRLSELHGSIAARLTLSAPFVGFRPPHSCSPLFTYRHHGKNETIEENGRNKDSNPRSRS